MLDTLDHTPFSLLYSLEMVSTQTLQVSKLSLGEVKYLSQDCNIETTEESVKSKGTFHWTGLPLTVEFKVDVPES